MDDVIDFHKLIDTLYERKFNAEQFARYSENPYASLQAYAQATAYGELIQEMLQDEFKVDKEDTNGID